MSAFSLPGVTGILVSDVPAESISAKAGVRNNDVIFTVDGGKTVDTAALLRQTSALPAGSSLKPGTSRDQKEMVVQLNH